MNPNNPTAAIALARWWCHVYRNPATHIPNALVPSTQAEDRVFSTAFLCAENGLIANSWILEAIGTSVENANRWVRGSRFPTSPWFMVFRPGAPALPNPPKRGLNAPVPRGWRLCGENVNLPPKTEVLIRNPWAPGGFHRFILPALYCTGSLSLHTYVRITP